MRWTIVTMRDVAEHAGVSVTTVSHVVNNTRSVNPDTRSRVEEAMRVMGYQPNVVARSLRRGKTHTIGIILPDSANPYFAEVVRGIEDTSFSQGYSVILCNSDNDLDKERLYTNVLLEKQVDGIIFVAAGLSGENIHQLQGRGIPLVLVDRRVPEIEADYVLTDNQGGGRLATRHLIDHGHLVIACIAGPEGIKLSSDRIAGYRHALDEEGIPNQPELIIEGDFQFQSGYHAAQRLFEKRTAPTAIFACNDLMAIGVYRFAHEKGLRIPEQLSVVGFDDIRLAAYAHPPLTTIRQPKHTMGSAAAKLLLERMNQRDSAPRLEVLEPQLITRESTDQVLQPVREMIT
ncbi:MAG: LacI family DNA-binding transcriptional regulator [Anaerolineales bacterium]